MNTDFPGPTLEHLKLMSRHANVRIGEYWIPLIGVPPDASREKCDLCGELFYIGDIDYDGSRFSCGKCRSENNNTTKTERVKIMPRKIQWQKSETIEKILHEFGLDWKAEELNLTTQIDDDLSSNNHARRRRLDDSVVTDYLTSMEQGEDFPYGVAVKQPGTSKYLVLGGNHTRKAAEEFDQKTMMFYVIETRDPMVLDLLPKALNRKHGLRKDREEAIQDAINAMAIHKLTPNEAADKFGVHVHTLHVNNRVTLALRRFKALGVKAEQMPRNAIVKLNTIPIDSVVEAAVKVAEKQKMTGPEVHALVDAIHEERSSEKAQLKVVDAFESELKSVGKVPLSKGTEQDRTWARYTRMLTTLDVMLRNKKSIRQLGCRSDTEKARIIVLQKTLSQKLHALSNENSSE